MKKALWSAVALAALAAAPAFAQGASEDEIVITAQRREQSAQDVGLAVSVISGAELTERGVTNVNGLENVTPGLDAENQFGGGQVSFTLRGVGFRDYATNNASTVGVYVDEVAYALPVMTQGVLFDLERVEVLRGPQGTLYGRNTTGGAVNLLSARPTQEFQTGATLEYGNYNAFRGEGFVSGPLGGGAAGRLSIASAQGGAWQVNREDGRELGDADRLAIRGQVSIPFTDDLTVDLNLHGFSDESDGLGLQLFKTTPSGARHAGQRQTSWGSSAEFAADNGISTTTAPFRNNLGFGASARATLDLGAANLTYIAAYEALERNEFNDWDAVPAGVAGVFFRSDAQVQSHELRLASEGDNRLDWIVGLYHSAEDLDERYNSDFADSFGAGFSVTTPYRQETRTTALFGQMEYQVAPSLNLIAGLRYEDETRDLIGLGTFANAFGPTENLATCTTPFNTATCTADLIDRSTSMSEVSGRLAAELRVSDDALLYASVSRGVKSGGFTAYNTLAPAALNPFAPEEVIAYEVGLRSDLFAGRLRLNGAAYYYDYNNQQVQGAIYVGGFVIGQIQNVPQSEIYGVELEAMWRPTDRLTITQAIGVAHGEFTEGRILDTAAPPATRPLNGVDIGFPEVTYSGSFDYTHPLSSGWALNTQFDYSYRSETNPPLLQPVSGEGYGVDAYWLANASIGLRPPSGQWELALWGRNIFDERYEETRNFFAGADFTPLSAPGLPATYGLRLSLRN